MRWIDRHGSTLQTLAAVVTGVAAVSALILVPLQIAGADRIQRDQTAREIYREFLNLTVQRPDLATADICALADAAAEAAHAAYVEYLLYTAEQTLAVSPDWRAPMQAHLADHAAHLCRMTAEEMALYDPDLVDLIETARGDCARTPPCG